MLKVFSLTVLYIQGIVLSKRTIFINGRFLSQSITGAQRYGHELLQEFDQLLEEGQDMPSLIVLLPRNSTFASTFKHIPVKRVGHFSGQLWEQIDLPAYAGGELVFTPCGGAPLFYRKNVITIHDAAVIAAPKGYSWTFRVWYQMLNWTLCHTARHVLTVSRFSRDELKQWYGATDRNTTVTYLAAEHVLRYQAEAEILRKHSLQPFRYVLLVASRNPNKNIAGMLKAISHLAHSGLQIAIAGHRDDKVFGAHEYPGEIHDLGYVSDSELRALYENAACFVFPSFYEGFGLPPLEALLLGCPVVLSHAGSLPEIFENVGIFCDPHNPRNIAEKIIQASLQDDEERRELRTFASKFSWRKCAEETLQVLEGVLARNS